MKKLVLLLLTTFTFLSACNKDAPPVTSQIDMGTFEGACKIDTERLKKMLDEYVYGEIDCIANNLKQFSDFVQRAEPEYIDRADLDKFISKFFSANSGQMVRALHVLFDVNTLFMGDRPNSIAVKKIRNLFDLVKTLNRFGVPLNKLFKGINDNKNYWEVRPRVLDLFQQLTSEVKDTIRPHLANSKQVNVMAMIRRFKDGLELSDDQLKPEVIEDYLFVKKLILGGDRNTIDTVELYNLLDKLPDVAISAFDVIYMNERPDLGTLDKVTFYLDTFMRLRGTLFNLDASEMIITHEEFMNFGEELIPKEDLDFRKIEPSIINIKRKLIGSDPSTYTYGDVTKVLNWGQDLVEQYYFNYVTYDHLRAIMENGQKIDDLTMPDLNSYKRFNRTRIYELWEEFKFIVINFRQIHSPDYLIYFTNSHYRSIEGINLKATLRYGLNIALNVYGHEEKDPRSGRLLFMAATIDELRNLLNDVADLMKELDFYPKYFERFLTEAQNSSDLFQHHSNGDGVISHIEATDYISNIIGATVVAKELEKALPEFCPIVPDEDGKDAFEVACYRKHLFKVVFEKLNYRKYYQKLYDYTVHFPASEIERFIRDVESFAKEERDTNIPMSVVDLGRLFVSFGNIEATMIRYDLNNSNILERSEVDLGFPVFKKTLILFGNLKPSQESLAESIYLYILKKLKAPKTVALIAFHLLGKKKDITARRMNIGAILALVAEQTIPKTENEIEQ